MNKNKNYNSDELMRDTFVMHFYCIVFINHACIDENIYRSLQENREDHCMIKMMQVLHIEIDT